MQHLKRIRKGLKEGRTTTVGDDRRCACPCVRCVIYVGCLIISCKQTIKRERKKSRGLTFTTQLHGNWRCSSRNHSGCANIAANCSVIAGIVCQPIWNANQFFALFINEIALLPVFVFVVSLAQQWDIDIRKRIYKFKTAVYTPISSWRRGTNSFVTYCSSWTGHGRRDKREITTKLLFVNK